MLTSHQGQSGHGAASSSLALSITKSKWAKSFPRSSFQRVLASDNVQTAATSWNNFHLAFIKPLERALSLAAPRDHRDREIFTSLLAAGGSQLVHHQQPKDLRVPPFPSPLSLSRPRLLFHRPGLSAQPACARTAMSYLLPHLNSGWAVDQAIISEEARVVCIRFGHDYDPICMQMDEVLYSIAELVKNYCVIYLVDITEVPDFNTMYELYDPCTVMFFYRNKHIMIDLGTGNNNKINWAIHDKQEVIDIIETVYRGARKGRGLVVSPKDYSTKYRY